MSNIYEVNEVIRATVKPYDGWGPLIIIKATECLKGWKYLVTFIKNDGTPHKRRERLEFFEDQITT